MLSRMEIQAYRRDGWVIPKGFRLNDHECQSLASAVDRVLADNPNILPDRMINTHLDGGAPYGIRGQKAIYDICHNQKILDMVEELLGPDIILLYTHLFCKPASTKRAVPWHQDGPFWPVDPMVSCSVWIAIDKVDGENGAMRVISGSHHADYCEHRLVDNPNSTLNREIDASQIDGSQAVTIELEPGQASLHDIGIIHGSTANSSARRRAGLALRYMPATSCMFRKMPDAAADWGEMPMEIVRGVNRNRRNNFSLGNFGHSWFSSG